MRASLLTGGLLLSGCVLGVSSAALALGVEQLRAATYAGIYDEPVSLTDGRYEGPPFVPGGASRPVVVMVDHLVAHGDLDGDGRADAAVLLVESSGGSGSFIYLAAMLDRDGEALNAGTVLVGDRASIRRLAIDDGAIVAETLVHAPDDAMPRPTRKRRVTFEWRDGQLSQGPDEDDGPLSIADLAGTAWRLLRIDGEGDVMADTELTAEFSADRVAGTAGCNRYSGSVADGGPAGIAIGPLLSTRMACPEPVMEQETAYLKRLEEVTQIGFSFGRLRLSSAETPSALLFEVLAKP